jgi:serine/threonine-protein kinase
MIESLGHYKVLERVGAGRIGEVYRARDTRHGRTVAIKVLAAAIADDPEQREQFLSDARDAAALSHPNVAAVYEIGETDLEESRARPFVVFEFVPGEPLTRVIGGRPLNARRAVDLAAQIADGLAEGHALGVVHRDIRPETVMVTPRGNAKLLDFGFVWWTAGGMARQTAAMALLNGTAVTPAQVAYLSPEQARGSPGDWRTDIFSLGALLVEMVTGRPPVGATAEAPRGLGARRTGAVPRELEAVIARALAAGPEERFQSGATMASELRAISVTLDARAAAAPPPVVPARKSRRSGWF